MSFPWNDANATEQPRTGRRQSGVANGQQQAAPFAMGDTGSNFGNTQKKQPLQPTTAHNTQPNANDAAIQNANKHKGTSSLSDGVSCDRFGRGAKPGDGITKSAGQAINNSSQPSAGEAAKSFAKRNHGSFSIC
jgi:hypothetical protein